MVIWYMISEGEKSQAIVEVQTIADRFSKEAVTSFRGLCPHVGVSGSNPEVKG